MAVLDDRNFEIEIKNGVSVVKFFSLWDSSSRIIEEPFKQLSDDFRGRAKFIASDINANQTLAQKQAITKVPTVIIYINGRQTARITDISKRTLREKIDYFVRKKDQLV